jgi:hypothetical protein
MPNDLGGTYKYVFEVDPLKCPKCGGTMKIVNFIEKHQTDIVENILKHCELWKKPLDRYYLRHPTLPPALLTISSSLIVWSADPHY